MGSTESKSSRSYLKLGAACVVLATTIAVIAAFLIPQDDVATDSEDAAEASPAKAILSSKPTITLPSTAAQFEAEELQIELLAIGGRLLERFPQVPQALHVVAMLYSDLKKTSQAKEIWEKCVSLAPRQPGPYEGLATAAMDLGKDQEAVDTLRLALQTKISTPEIYHQLSAALTKMGWLDEAAEVSQQGLAAFPEASKNWLQIGQLQLQLQQPVQAEISLRKAIAEGESSGAVYYALANACVRQGKQDDAAKYLEEFGKRKKEPEVTDDKEFQQLYDRNLRQTAVATMSRAGAIYAHHDEPSRAESLYLRALSLDPANRVACAELVTLYRRRGRIADARLVQRRLVQVEPNRPQHHLNLAKLSAQIGDTESAEAALKHVISMHPDLSIGYSSLAQLYLQTRQIEKARWFAEAALKLNASSPRELVTTYMVLATACTELGDKAAAEDALAKAQKVSETISN